MTVISKDKIDAQLSVSETLYFSVSVQRVSTGLLSLGIWKYNEAKLWSNGSAPQFPLKSALAATPEELKWWIDSLHAVDCFVSNQAPRDWSKASSVWGVRLLSWYLLAFWPPSVATSYSLCSVSINTVSEPRAPSCVCCTLGPVQKTLVLKIKSLVTKSPYLSVFLHKECRKEGKKSIFATSNYHQFPCICTQLRSI